MKAPVLTAACALLVSIAACSASPDSSADDGPPLDAPAQPDVVGTWGDPSAPQTPSLTFDTDGTVVGTDGCNQLGGEYSMSGADVTFDDMHMTLRACPDVDDWLNQASTATVDGATLTVFNEKGDPVGMLSRSE